MLHLWKRRIAKLLEDLNGLVHIPVSYTHLDVYKRQALTRRERPLISITEYETVFPVLQELLRRPRVSDEDRNLGRADYPMLLLNSARGLALSSLFAAAGWKKRDLVAHGTADATLNQIWPDFARLLTALLSDSDPVVHASLGEQFWCLRYLDERWLQANVERIFPLMPDQQTQFKAGWSMFLRWSGSLPDESWLALLRPYYDHALRLWTQEIAERPRDTRYPTKSDDNDRALGSELGALYV